LETPSARRRACGHDGGARLITPRWRGREKDALEHTAAL
jgi:hypothetical protein